MHSKPKTAPVTVYVIVVTFNMLDGLRKTLSSIKQVASHSNGFEIKAIVVNGNPDDIGYMVAAEYSGFIYKYIAEADLGIYDAMNKGIASLPESGYAIFINSDDELLWVPLSLFDEKQEVIFCNVLSYDERAHLREVFQVSPSKNLDSSNLLRPRVHHQGCFVKTRILKNYKFDLQVGVRADVLLMGLLLKNHKSTFRNDIVSQITTGGKSDCYNFSNFLSFFLVADILGINRISIIIWSFPEVIKYSIKGLVGKSGILFLRKIKSKYSSAVSPKSLGEE